MKGVQDPAEQVADEDGDQQEATTDDQAEHEDRVGDCHFSAV